MDIKELKIPRKTERLKRFFNCIFYSDPHFTIDENLVDYKNQIEECKIPHLYPIPSVENFIHFIDNYDKSD
jgi:transcription elongation factor Elf1